MNAPKATKAEWPKFSTSISPKITERPDAIRKIIMPMASPATVNVTQVEGRPISRKATSARMTGSSMTPPNRSKVAESVVIISMRFHRQAQELVLQRLVGGELRHRAAMDDAAVVDDRDGVAQRPREMEILLDQQDRRLRRYLAEGVDHGADDRRGQPLGRLVDQDQVALLDDGARDGQHLLLPAGKRVGLVAPEFFHGRKQGEDSL